MRRRSSIAFIHKSKGRGATVPLHGRGHPLPSGRPPWRPTRGAAQQAMCGVGPAAWRMRRREPAGRSRIGVAATAASTCGGAAGASSRTCATVQPAHRPSVEPMQLDPVAMGRPRAGSSWSPQIQHLYCRREPHAVLQPQICRRERPREQLLQIHRRGCYVTSLSSSTGSTEVSRPPEPAITSGPQLAAHAAVGTTGEGGAKP